MQSTFMQDSKHVNAIREDQKDMQIDSMEGCLNHVSKDIADCFERIKELAYEFPSTEDKERNQVSKINIACDDAAHRIFHTIFHHIHTFIKFPLHYE